MFQGIPPSAWALEQSSSALARVLLVATVLAVPASVDASEADARLETLSRLRVAREAGDAASAAAHVAEDPRIWFGRVQGAGARWSPVSGGPWAEWDRFFHSDSELLSTRSDVRSVRVRKRENNDWYRLVGRAPSEYFVTWYFDAEGRVEGLLIHGLPDEEKDRGEDLQDEFEDWARRERPGLLEELMPEGRLDPAPPKPELWKRWLITWREATGRPLPELRGGP